MKQRFLIKELEKHSEEKEITLLFGARQVGKTTLLKQLKGKLSNRGFFTSFISLEDKTILTSLNEHPKNLFQFIPILPLETRHYVFIDEIQYLDDPSNFLKLLYDQYDEKIKFIVSGSSGFYIDKKFTDSLAGRKRIFYLPTMDFREFLFFHGFDGIMNYVHSDDIPKLYLQDLKNKFSEYLIYGGFPAVVLESTPEEKVNRLKELAMSYVKKDIQEASIQYPDICMKIMKIIAGQIGSQLNPNTIGKALKINYKTVESYIQLMQKSFHVSLVSPFFRSAIAEVRKMKKIYFNDLGLRNYFVNNFHPVLLREDRGNLLENYVFRFLSDRYDDWDIRYWRTQKKQEVDFVVQEKRAYEVKFSKSSFKLSKYKTFREKYNEIPLNVIHYDNVLEFNPNSKN
ncbi:MAG: ATP-binding protein [Candidatus Marinimicrobia bacterium]|nr:ATP-binding protein [Candidatus Neomarinimicrobiota bacterium]